MNGEIGSKVDFQRTVRRGAEVDTIEEAFAFCLTGIEDEAMNLPTIHIEPIMTWDEDAADAAVRYEVSVTGEVADGGLGRVEGVGDN